MGEKHLEPRAQPILSRLTVPAAAEAVLGAAPVAKAQIRTRPALVGEAVPLIKAEGALEFAVGQPGQYWLCPGLKAFFAHAVPVLERVMAMSARGMKPQEIMAGLEE